MGPGPGAASQGNAAPLILADTTYRIGIGNGPG